MENMENLENNEIKEEMQAQEQEQPKKRQKHWYVVNTYSGHENKVKANLEKRIDYLGLTDKIFRIEVPQKTVTKMKEGKKQSKEEKIFPGYVLVEMIMEEDSWYAVRHTQGVSGFVGANKNPLPARESEIRKVIQKAELQPVKVQLDIEPGESAKITSGPFADFECTIVEVYPDKMKLRAMVSIFGRETPVELEYNQIEKIK